MAEKVDSAKADEIKKDKERQLNTLISLSDRFGDSLANAFAKNIAEGKRFDDVLKQVRSTLKEFAGTGFRALRPLWPRRGCDDNEPLLDFNVVARSDELRTFQFETHDVNSPPGILTGSRLGRGGCLFSLICTFVLHPLPLGFTYVVCSEDKIWL